jgi:hypothetical protein
LLLASGLGRIGPACSSTIFTIIICADATEWPCLLIDAHTHQDRNNGDHRLSACMSAHQLLIDDEINDHEAAAACN